MKLNTEQCMLLIAAALSIVMMWCAAVEHHVMAWAFFGELMAAVALFALSVKRSRKEKPIVGYRTEEEY